MEKHSLVFSENKLSVSVYDKDKAEIGRIALADDNTYKFFPWEQIGTGCAFALSKYQLIEISNQLPK
jgi:hypothetical protein